MRRRTGTTPGEQGRFAGYDVLAQLSTWDEVTAGVVLRRLRPPQPLRYFSPAEQATATAIPPRADPGAGSGGSPTACRVCRRRQSVTTLP